jgi:hypothetical protein
MYYFIKKTNELVKNQKVPFYSVCRQKKRGTYIRILLGQRKDKAFFIFENQLLPINKDTPLSNFELDCLKCAHTDNTKWKEVCSIIKMSRGNEYPKDWIQILKRENLMNEQYSYNNNLAEDKITIGAILTNLIKSMNNSPSKSKIKNTNTQNSASEKKNLMSSSSSPNVPTIIFLDTEGEDEGHAFDLFGAKRKSKINISNLNKNNKNQDPNKIFFTSNVQGSSVFCKNIDFISRVQLNNIINETFKIETNIKIECSYPYENTVIVTPQEFTSKKEFICWIKNELPKHEKNLKDNMTYEDIGIDYLYKNENMKNNYKYSLYFLY